MLMCTECVMRRRIASIERDGTEPPRDYRITDGLPKPNPAETVIQGQALCHDHLIECVQIQRQSALSGPNGAPLLIPGGG